MYSLNGKISSDLMKIVALVTMVIDHASAIILQRGIMTLRPGIMVGPFELSEVAMLLRAIGRLAFPIFAYLIVEGFFYTSSKKNYAIRLFLFALISEIPFDIALRGQFIDANSQNVFFTLWIGFMTIWCITFFENKEDNKQKILGIAGCIAVSIVIAELLHTDYSSAGIVLISAFYLTRKLPRIAAAGISYLCFMVAEVFKLSAYGWSLEAVCIIAFFLIMGCNGQRKMKMNKWFFYIFYPAHLLILKLISLPFS